MHWPRKIHTREMLTKETHAAEKFSTPPNTLLMVRFKCCFSMNVISVIQFVLRRKGGPKTAKPHRNTPKNRKPHRIFSRIPKPRVHVGHNMKADVSKTCDI